MLQVVRRGVASAVLVIAVVVGGTVMGLPGATSAPAGATTPSWQVSAAYFEPAPISVVSCATTNFCVGVGGDGGAGSGIALTLDGGAHWVRTLAPSTDTQLRDVSCPTTSYCVAVNFGGDGVITSINDGITWTVLQSVPADAINLLGVSCTAGTTTCVAVGENSVVGTTDGSTWTDQTLPSDVTGATAASCPTVSECFATTLTSSAGSPGVMQTIDGGSTWTVDTGAPGVVLGSISCATTSYCVASSDNGLYNTNDAGATWPSVTLADTHQINDVSCALGTTTCMAGGTIGGESSYDVGTTDGTTWSTLTVPTSAVVADITCVTVSTCIGVASGGDVVNVPASFIRSDTAGASWISQVYPIGNYPFNAVGCGDPTHCVAPSNPPMVTSDGGSTWTQGDQIVSNPLVASMSCPTSTTCFAAGEQGINAATVVISTDGGVDFTAQSTPSLTDPLTGIYCPTPDDCVAVGGTDSGSSIIATTNGGANWTAETPPAGVDGLDAVACTSSTTCIAAAADGPALIGTTDGGATWTPQTVPSGVVDITGIACSSALVCVAVTGGLNTGQQSAIIGTDDAGATWSIRPFAFNATTGVAYVNTVVCAGETCEATGGGRIIGSSDGGVSWAAQTLPNGSAAMNSLACPAPTRCFAAGGSIYGGGVLLSITLPGPLAITTTTLPGGTVGAAYASGLAATGGGAGYTWSLQSGTLPPGVSLNPSTGALHGTPTAAGDFSPTFAVTDADANSTTIALAIHVSKSASTTSVVVSPTAVTAGQTVTYTVHVVSPGASPSGSVTIATGATAICANAPVSSGVASCTSTAAPFGNDIITASYPGDANVTGSSSTATLTVLPNVPHGYWLVGTDGGIFTFGSANFFGSTGSLKLNRPIVGITPTADEGGYWLVASDGGIFSFGDSAFFGSVPGLGLAPAGTIGGKHLNAPIVGMVPTLDGGGYFMVASDGGVFALGDAAFEGSCPSRPGGCAGAAVGVAPDASGQGYWLVTASGNVYNFGDAPNLGEPGPQDAAVTSIVRTPDGKGYWILNDEGRVFPFGDAARLGSLLANTAGGLDPASAIFATADGDGYWVVTALGAVYNFGDAPNDSDVSNLHLNGSIIAATGF